MFSHLSLAAGAGESIGFFVACVIGVSLNPLPFDVVWGSEPSVHLLALSGQFDVSLGLCDFLCDISCVL